MIKTLLYPTTEYGSHVLKVRSLLDTVPEERFDRITRIAAKYFDTPIALFVLFEEQSCWCKSQIGLAPTQAFNFTKLCGSLLERDSLLNVNNTGTDAISFQTCGLASNESVHFFASMPVQGRDGIRIGALCLFDVRRRQIDADEQAILADFANLLERELAVDEMELRLLQQKDCQTSIRGLLDYMPESVLMLSPDGIIESCNAAAENMYAAATNGLVGRHASDLTGEDPTRLRHALNAGARDQLQAIARRIDGTEFIAEFSVKVFGAPNERRYVLAVRDISTRKDEEQKARDANARQRKYFVTATHELRTPMASVVGFAELLLKRDFNEVERQEMTEIIHRQAVYLVKLINEMLDLARIESGGKDALDLRPQNVEGILERTLSLLKGLGATPRIRCSIAPNLPSILADTGKIQQALNNIISNAVKYSVGSSEIRIEVFATSLNSSKALAFRVIDSGIGMTVEQKAKIFDPFYRANINVATIGTGLGMTICKEIIDLHSGVVQIESTLGVGTEISLLLPAASNVS